MGKLVEIPSVKCAPVDQAKSRISRAGFTVDGLRHQVASDCPAGTVARTEPGGATVKGGPVALIVSKGQGAPAPPYLGNDPGTGNGVRDDADCPLPWVC